VLCLAGSVAFVTEARAATKTIKRGDTRRIYMRAELFAEAQNPSYDLADGGTPLCVPGADRLYGYPLQDLSHYLQKMTGARFPFAELKAEARNAVAVR
jgi:hypothetical protein